MINNIPLFKTAEKKNDDLFEAEYNKEFVEKLCQLEKDSHNQDEAEKLAINALKAAADFYCRESGYLKQNLFKIIKLFKPSGLYNMTMRVKLYGPFLYKKKGRTQHLTSVSSFTPQCFR